MVSVFGLLIGLIIAGGCGYSLARVTGARPLWAVGVLYAHLAIFLSVLLLAITGLPISRVSCWVVLILVASAAIPFWQKKISPANGIRWTWPVVIAVTGMAVMIHIAFWSPLQGWDTSWRWDFLAREIAARGTLAFYPPRSAADFAIYGYPDGFAPLVSSVYAYLYLSAGEPLPAATGVAVVLQWTGAIILAADAAEGFRKGSGQWAGLLLACSGLFFWGTAIGQETGLTGLATAGLLAASFHRDSGRLAMALPLATTALCREYGPGLALAGGVMLLVVRDDRGRTVQAIGLAIGLALPWSLRNAVLTGNPLWSHRLLGLPANEVHGRLIAYYQEIFSPAKWTAAQWGTFAIDLLQRSGPPLALVVPAIASLAKINRRAAVGVSIFTLVAAAIAFASISYTSGGFNYALRVLSPALVAGAFVTSIWIAALWDRGGIRKGLIALIFAAAALLAINDVHDLTKDGSLFQVRRSPYDKLIAPPDFRAAIHPAKRVLTDHMEVYVQLKKLGIDVVPIWSPEVSFVFEPDLSGQEVARKLVSLHITRVAMQHENDPLAYNMHAVKDVPFFQMLNRVLPFSARINRTHVWILPGQTPDHP